MSLRKSLVALLGVALGASLCAAEPNLAAWYTFDEGAGVVAGDKSGNGNEGKILGNALWAKGDFGCALDFDGAGAYLDCGQLKNLNLDAGGAVAVWCCPRSFQGGIVGWFTGGSWDDAGLFLAFNTYSGGDDPIGCFGTGKSHQQLQGVGLLETKAWVHLALVFDGKNVQLYRNGALCKSMAQEVAPVVKGAPLWIGRCEGLGSGYFDGLIDEVRVYNGPLSAEQVLALYKEETARRGKDVASFVPPQIQAAAYPGPGKIVASVQMRSMLLPTSAETLSVELCSPGSSAPVQRRQLATANLTRVTDVLFDAQDLPPGEYSVRCALLGSSKEASGEEAVAKVTWPGRPPEFKGVKVLNNLVWELLNAKAGPGHDIGPALAFNNPCDRWIFIRATAKAGQGEKLEVSVDSQDAPAIGYADGSKPTQEAMRYLPAGPHTLNIKAEGGARLQQVIVRSIPMLQYAFYDAQPYIGAYGPYDWAFLKKEVLPNINVMTSTYEMADAPELKDWKKSGRKWISSSDIPSVKGADAAAVDAAYKHWAAIPGFANPLMDGIIVDEFGGGDSATYDVYRKAVERLYANPQFKGKMYMPYFFGYAGPGPGRAFAKAAIDGGGYIAWECYLYEKPTQAEALADIRSQANAARRWETLLPGATRRLCVVYGCMSQPTESLNLNPLVDFRVFMDMQIQELATNPAYFGLGGIQEYHSSYCDEENLRLTGRLYRHYAIEGNTTPLITDPYVLTHIQNPDFENGTTGWTISPAEKGSIEQRKASLSWLEGRFPQTDMGNTFLWMKRSAAGPNAFSQEIKDLTPGKLYSMKMITTDYQDLIQEKSNKAADAVTIRLDNAEVLPGPKDSFQFTFFSNWAHTQGKFKREHPFYMNYHWRVFRAEAATAKVTVSDWASEKEPGGPIGQELTCNFIEIEPYIGE
jgi:hypothetical protein